MKNKTILKILYNQITDMLKCLQWDQYVMKNNNHKYNLGTLFMFILISVIAVSPIELASASENVKFKKIADVSAGDGFDILVDEGNDHCFVSLGYTGVKLYDLTSMKSPELIGWKNEENNGYAHQLYKRGTHIYVGDCRAGLTVINWSDPENFVTQNRTLGYYGWSATSDDTGETLFLASGGSLFGYDTEIVLFNITNPGQLELITEIPIPDYCVDVEFKDGVIYTTSDAIPLISIDVSNVSDPIILDMAPANSGESAASDIEIVGNYAFISNWEGPFQVFNIQNPENLTLVYENELYSRSAGVSCDGDVLYLTDEIEGLVLLNITDPTEPIDFASYNDGRFQYRVDIVGNFIFMTQQSYGFIILEMIPKQIPGISLGFIIITLIATTGILLLLLRKKVLK